MKNVLQPKAECLHHYLHYGIYRHEKITFPSFYISLMMLNEVVVTNIILLK